MQNVGGADPISPAEVLRARYRRRLPQALDELLGPLVADDTRYRQTSSVEAYRRATASMLEMVYGPGAVKLPSRSTFQRLVKDLASRHGRARGIPVADRAWIRSSRPGERVYVDTVALGLPQRLAHLASQRVLMTVAVDELTRSVCTVMVHSSRRPLDGLLLLARLCDPPALRDPNAGSTEEAMPLITPESLLIDRKLIRRPRAFTDACRRLGINLVAPEPEGKGHGERVVGRLVSLFNAELAAVEAEWITDEASLITWLQVRAERWVESFWQNQPQPGLRNVASRGERPTPTSAYDACVAQLGWVHLPLGGDSARSLLPCVKRWVAMNGVCIGGRRYDCPDLGPPQTAASHPSNSPTPRMEVRFDPHDVRQVWVQSEDRRWIRTPLAGTEPRRRHFRRADLASAVHREGWSPPVDLMPPPSQSLLDDDQERLAYHAQLHVLQTPFLQEVLRLGDRLVMMNHAAVGGHHGLLITGPPRSGKTTALQQLGRRFERVARSRHHGRSLRVPAAYLRIQPGDSTHTVLLNLAGLLPAPSPPRRMGTAAAVRNALFSSGTSVVLVDDALAAEGSSPRSPALVDDRCYLAEPAGRRIHGFRQDSESNHSRFDQAYPHKRLTDSPAAEVPRATLTAVAQPWVGYAATTLLGSRLAGPAHPGINFRHVFRQIPPTTATAG
ncbi:Mu transposase C-terminal domain-containing protein [Streptomyces sp. NPDC002920]